MTIDFATNADKLFTRVIYQVHEATTRYILVFGGSSSSKSYSVHQLELLNIMLPGTGDTMFIRKENVTLRDSCFKLLKTLIYEYGLQDLFDIYEGVIKIVHKESKRSILFKGIDDPEKIKSIVGIKRIIIEEASQLEVKDFTELRRRARGIEGIQMILITNPISENHWIKTELVDKADMPAFKGRLTILKFTYKDNCNKEGVSYLTEDDIIELEANKDSDDPYLQNQYRIYTLGEWGIENKEGKFAWAYSDKEHIKPTVLVDNEPIYLSYDFNVNPLASIVCQIFPDIKTLRVIKCIKLQNSDIWKMCAVQKAEYMTKVDWRLWKVTGDATGQARSAASKDNMTYYHIIMSELELMSNQMYVPTSNPNIEENQVIVNAVLRDWTVEIDPINCKDLIDDLRYVEIDELKKIIGKVAIVKDRSAKHKYADFLDAFRYAINTFVKPYLDFSVRK